MRQKTSIFGLTLALCLLAGPVFGQSTDQDRYSDGYRTNAAGCSSYFSGWDYALDFTWTGPCPEKIVNGKRYNMAEGRGHLTVRRASDGRLEQDYVGDIKNGRYDGWGQVGYYDADSGAETVNYTGQWVDDVKQGYGRLRFPNGDIYTGDFKNDDFDGQGTYVWADGSRYEGQWQNGARNGKGTFYNSSSNCCGDDYAKYVGQFKDGEFHGRGVQYDGNGRVVRRGLWQNGCPYDGSAAQWRRDNRK